MSLSRSVMQGVFVLPLLVLSAVGAAPAGPDNNDPVLAAVNGKLLRLSDLEHEFASQLFQARANYYDAERKVLDQLVDEQLLEEQARKENLTVAQLLEKHVDRTIAPDPSEEALRVYYEGIDTSESFDTLRPKIVTAIHDRRMARAKAAYLASLRAESQVTYHLAPPRAPLSLTEIHSRGPAGASVTLLEFADYECPYCQQIQPAVDKLEQEYKGRIDFVYKDFPLPMHPNAEKAAEASQCAARQGKYWEYHDQLTKTKQLDLSALKNHARTLNLDTAAFNPDLS